MDELGAQTEPAAQLASVLTDKVNSEINISATGCEEILLPADSIANGTDVGVTHGLEFYEDNEPMLPENDPIEEINDFTVITDGKISEQHELVEETEELEGTEETLEHAECTEAVDPDVSLENGETMEPEETHEIETYRVTEADGSIHETEGAHVVSEELEDEEDEEEEDEEEVPVERIPTQVPKKRKDASLFAVDSIKVEMPNPTETITADNYAVEETPTSSARANKDNVDEQQCRVCTTKEDLVSLFKIIDNMTIADMLMTICPTVSISLKDFMPQYICNPCLDNVTIAVQLKMQCESTEKDLRKKLSRHKNKVRRPTGYVVIDAPVESEGSEEEEPNDEEYKVSDEASISYDDDSDDSDYSNKKKRVRGTVAKRGRRKSAVTPTIKSRKKPLGRKRATGESTDEESVKKRQDDFGVIFYSSDEENHKNSKRKRHSGGGSGEFPCDECEQVFTRKASLVLHKKAHSGRALIHCEICGKQFKIQGAYRTHLEKHRDDSGSLECNKCFKIFNIKSELRRHLAEEHDEINDLHQCMKCKRTFVTASRLQRHKDGRCPGVQSKSKRNELEGYAMGRDLFKSVAPLTTTYWSDSFSD